MKKRILSMLLVIVLVLSMVPVSALAADGLKVTSTKSSKYVVIGVDEITLGATDLAGTAITGELTFEFDPADRITKVSTTDTTCKIAGAKQGEVTVKVTDASGKIGTKTLTVIQPPENLQLVEAGTTEAVSGNLKVGETVTLGYTCTNSDDIESAYITTNWKVQNANPTDALTVDSAGVVKAVKEGSAQVRFAMNGKSVVQQFTISPADPPALKELTIVADKTTMYPYRSLQLTATVDGVTWASSDEAIATVSNTGLVTSKDRTGKVTITATKGSHSATCEIEVVANAYRITDENGNEVKEIKVGQTVNLQVLDKSNTPLPDFTWSVTGGSATVEPSTGVLTGTADSTITVTAIKGSTTVTQEITVKSNSLTIKAGDVVLNPDDGYSISAGNTVTLTAVDSVTGETVAAKWNIPKDVSSQITVGYTTGLLDAKAATNDPATLKVSATGYDTVYIPVMVRAKGTFRKPEIEEGKLILNQGCHLVARDAANNEVQGVTWEIVSGSAKLEDNVLTVTDTMVTKVKVKATHPDYNEKSATFSVVTETPNGVTLKVNGKDFPSITAAQAMIVGEKLPFNLQPVPAIVSFPEKITLTSGNDRVVKVEGNQLVAVGPGNAVLTASYEGNALGVFNVEVKATTQIVLDDSLLPVFPATTYTMLAGDELVLKAYLVDTASGKKINADVTWELAKESYGDFGRLDKNTLDTDSELLGRRTIELIASVDGAKYDAVPLKYTVNVVPRATAITLWVDGRKVNDKETVLDLNNDYEVANGVTIEAGITPAEAGQGVVWNITDDLGIYQSTQTEATDTDYASLTLKPTDAKRSGTITVKAVAKDGTKVFATTTVRFAKLGSGNLSGAPTALRGGASLNLRTYLEQDKDLDVKGVTWGFENNSNVVNGKKIASISKTGKLTTKAVKEPTPITVTIKGSAGGYVPHTITLYPTAKSVKITCDELKALNNKVELSKDKEKRQFQLVYAVNPKDLKDVWSVTWSSTDESIAKVNKNGQLTVKAPGKVRIDCTINDGSKVKGCLYLDVTSTVDTVTVTPTDRSLTAGESLDMKAVITTPTGRKAADQRVVWSIADEFGEETTAASITGTGRVVAKNVDQATVVVVTATSVANSEVYGTAELTIKPNTKKTLHAYIDGEMVSGTISMNLNDSCIVDGMWLKNNGGLQDTKDCQFFSSNTNVATVDEELGTLTAVGYGTTTITLRCTDPQTNSQHNTTFTVKVMKKVGTVTISAPDLKDLRSGKSVSLGATAWADYANGVKADNQSFTWEVHEVVNDEVQDKETDAASINSNGVLYAGKVAYKRVVEVRAISKESGVSAAVRFNIFPADSVALAFMLDSEEYANILPIDIDDYSNALPLKVMVHEAIADAKGNITEQPTYEASVTWSSDNKNVVEVKDNVLYVKAIGKAKLTAKYYRTADKKTYQASITVVVNQTVGSVEEIQLSNILVAGKSAYLRAAFENVNATNKNVLWFVTGVNADKVQLNTYTGRIKAKSNIDERITVHVVASPVDGSDGEEADIMIYPRTTKVEILNVVNGATVRASMSDESLVFEATAAPTGAYADSFKWTSSNTKIAEVDDEGNVTLKKAGAVTIKATALDGSGKYARFKLRITND